jgi:hypothetical protein
MLSALYLEVGRALVPVYRSGGHYARRSQDVAQFGSVGLGFRSSGIWVVPFDACPRWSAERQIVGQPI